MGIEELIKYDIGRIDKIPGFAPKIELSKKMEISADMRYFEILNKRYNKNIRNCREYRAVMSESRQKITHKSCSF